VRTLVVTNDYPPRPGGIQTYVQELLVRQPADQVVVLASSWKGAADFDAAQPFPVIRADTSVLLPTPATLRQARDLARAEACDRVWFGAAAPLGLLASGLRLERAVGSTYGHEVLWAGLPVGRQVLRRIARGLDAVTHLTDWTASRLTPFRETPSVLLPPGVDATVFRPGCGGEEVRERHGLRDRPVIVCVSRLVTRKGQDQLIRALPLVQQAIPDVALLLVGGGPQRAALEKQAAGLPVVFTGSVPPEELPAHYDAGDVFAMPCRSRYAGLEVEGLGIVFLEASATGLPVVAGVSGGSSEAVVDGVTGHLVDEGTLAARLIELLADPLRAKAMGAAGRAWVEQDWTWTDRALRWRTLLAG
jgi:phosphatidylinositol alpha-1,6-mannosyltransferase